ncbi:MAG: S41 family peptidase [Planctomycetota bacterium]
MVSRSPLLVLLRMPALLLAGLLAFGLTGACQAVGQPLAQPALGAPVAPAATPADEAVRIAPEAMPSAVAEALARGGEFEAQQQWADALSLYEDAVRLHPGEPQLQRRFEVARLHFGIERRYADASFLAAVQEMSPREASQLYGELLRKIDSHYVVTPDWDRIASRGAASVQLAVAKPAVRRHNGLRAAPTQVDRLQRDIRHALDARRPIRTAADAVGVQRDVARLAADRIGFSPVATTLEFTSASTCGLDTYSGFLTPDQLRDVYSQIEGNFVGLGVELKGDNGSLLILRVIPGSPAEAAGIADGDRIVAVNGQATTDLSTDDAAALLTGEEGSLVTVTVVSPSDRPEIQNPAGGNAAFNNTAAAARQRRLVSWAGQPAYSWAATVRRAHVDVPSLEDTRILDAQYGVAYVHVPVFQKATSRDLDAALWDLHSKGMRSLILDLRGNPGGLLTASVELADKFVSQGAIVSTRGRSNGEDFDYRAHRAGTWRVPLVVLIDGDSASASEIFAAAIRDNRRGTIVGARSYGKGSVQGIFPLGQSGAGIRLTTAKFYSPTGQPISKVGVSPDIVVRHATSVADGRATRVGFRGPGNGADAALDRAIEAAKQQMAMR